MRSLKTGLVAIAISGLLTTAAVVGCSADGSSIVGDINPTETPEAGATLPPTLGDDDDDTPTPDDSGIKDAGKKDSSKPEASVDAGPPPPVPGTACTLDGDTRSKECGACGKQETACLSDGAGALKWTEYGVCGGELTGGCIPGTTVDEPCGNCGTVKKTCTKYCAYTSGACTGQPPVNCKPGAVELTTAGCTTPSTYRERICGETCTWGSFSATCDMPTSPNKMNIPTTVNGVVSAQWTLTGATKRPSTCPAATISSSTTYKYAAVELTNTTAKAAEVSVYQSKSPTGKANADLYMWGYNGGALPVNDTLLAGCGFGPQDYCFGSSVDAADAPCGNTGSNYYYAGIEKVTIPAGGKVVIFNSAYGASTDVGDGTFMLNIKTTKLQ